MYIDSYDSTPGEVPMLFSERNIFITLIEEREFFSMQKCEGLGKNLP